MRKSIFFCEISHLGRVAEGEFDDVFAALRGLGIGGFQLADSDIERAGEERLRAAMARHGMRADIIHIFIPLLSKDESTFRAACRKATDTLALLKRFSCRRLMIVALPVSDVEGESDRERAMARMIEGLAEDVRDGDVEKASAIISECIYRSLDKLVAGERKDAVDYNRLAEYIHRKYLAENKDIKRNNLPPFKQMRDSMIDYCKRMWPQEKVAILNMWLNVEKMEQEKEQKEAKGM